MTDKVLKVSLKADDQLTGTFKKVGDASQEMGDAIEQSTKAASEGAKTLASDIRALEKDLNTVGMSVAAMGAAGTAFFSIATMQSMEFTSAMANVNSIARLSNDELSELEQTVLGLTTQFGAVPTDLANALYDIIGSGFEANDAIQILTASTVAAGAGLTSTETAAGAVTAVLNAYRLSADEAGNVSDVLFKIVDSGVITFEELAGSMGRVLPLAASLGVGLEELGAAYAALTLQGISPSEAETGISAILTAAIAPTEALTAAVEAYGYESAEALIAAEGFVGFLQFLQQAAGGSTTVMSELMGNVRATNAALALGANDGQVYADMLEDMGGAAQDGAYTLEVFGIQMDNAAGSVKMMSAELSVAAITIGSVLEPLVGYGATAISGIVGAFNDMSPAAQGAATALGAVGSGVALFTGAAMIAIPRALELFDAMRRIRQGSTLAAAAFGPWGLAVAGLTAAVVIGASAWMGHRREVEAAEAAYNSVGETALEVQDIVNNMKLSGTDLELAGQIDEINLWTAGTLEAIQTVNEQRLDWDSILQINYTQGSDAASDSVRTFLDGSIGRGFIQWALENDKLGAETIQILMEGTGPELVSTVATIQPIMDEFFAAFDVPPEMHERVSENTAKLVEYMMKPLVDSEQVMADWNEARKKYLEDPLEPDTAGYDAWLKQYLIDLPDVTASAAAAAEEIGNIEAATRGVTGAMGALQAARDALPGLLDEGLKEYNEYIAEVVDNLTALNEVAGVGDPLSQWNLSGHASDMSLLAMNTTAAATALDSVFRVVVGNTDAIGSQVEGVLNWATELIGVAGQYGEIDRLLNDGLITQQQYNDAQTAFNDIAQDSASIQDYILKIQAMQAPLIADQTGALENQMEIISNLPAAQQLVALGWMDSTTAGRAMEFQTLAVAAATGKLGENGEEVFASMITGAAQADPVLKALLIDMGLISEGADGTITVNLSGVDGALSEMEELMVVMVNYMDLMDNNSLDGSVSFEVLGLDDPRDKLDAIDQQVDDMDGKQAAIDLVVNAESPEGDINSLLTGVGDQLKPLVISVSADTAQADQDIDNLATERDPIFIPVEVDFEGLLGGAGGGVGSSLGSMAAGAIPAITIPVTVDDSSAAGMLDTYGAMDGSTIATTYVWAIGNDDSAAGMVSSYQGRDAETLAQMYVWAIGNDASAAGMVSGYQGRNAETLASMYVWAIGNAGSAQGMIDTYGAYDGVTLATMYIDVITRSSRIDGNALGGMIQEYASGGVLFRAAEQNRPEIAYFANGGTALLPTDGYYSAPAGTYISPNNAVGNTSYGGDIHVHLNGPVFGMSDLADQVSQELVPVISDVFAERMRGMGV